MYGLIMTLRRDNRLVKHIPWSAFKLMDNDWIRVIDASDILAVGIIYIFHFKNLLIASFTIQTEFSNTSLLRKSPRFGGYFPLLKNCKRHGRRNTMMTDTFFIRAPFRRDLRS